MEMKNGDVFSIINEKYLLAFCDRIVEISYSNYENGKTRCRTGEACFN